MDIPLNTLSFLTLSELSTRLRRREIGSVEATHAILDRIHGLNPTLRAYLTILEASAHGVVRFMVCPLPSRISAGPKAFRPPARVRCFGIGAQLQMPLSLIASKLLVPYCLASCISPSSRWPGTIQRSRAHKIRGTRRYGPVPRRAARVRRSLLAFVMLPSVPTRGGRFGFPLQQMASLD